MGGEELGQQGRWTVRKCSGDGLGGQRRGDSSTSQYEARKESEAHFSGDQEAAAGVRARGKEKIQGGDE